MGRVGSIVWVEWSHDITTNTLMLYILRYEWDYYVPLVLLVYGLVVEP